MISRRELFVSTLAVSLADVAMAQSEPSRKMTLSIHQNTSRAAGYRKSLEGWAKAGIKFVEITDVMLDEFLKTDTHRRREARHHRPRSHAGVVGGGAPGHLDPRRRARRFARDVEAAMRAVRDDRSPEDLLPVDHQPPRHGRRLQGDARLHPRSR